MLFLIYVMIAFGFYETKGDTGWRAAWTAIFWPEQLGNALARWVTQ